MGGGATFFDNMVEVRARVIEHQPGCETTTRTNHDLAADALWRRTPRAEHLTFTVYTRAQCCCCHKALDVLKRRPAAVRLRDRGGRYRQRPDLVAQFDTEVPVVALNGKVRFRGVVNPRSWTGCFWPENQPCSGRPRDE